MNILTCPVCGEKLNIDGKAFKCANSHSFDIAKQGYVNLLLTNKSGDKRATAGSRHIQEGNFCKRLLFVLRDYVTSKLGGTVLDICCGEGYYDEYQGELYGFDISREMVRLAASARKEHNYFVANLANIPIEDNSIDTAMHLFAPFNEKNFIVF